MKTAEIREKFLSYFESKGHKRVASSSLVPADDPTLLFTNAGMNQFKDVFLGRESRSYKRATTSQKCVRAGGKHNDLENVGYTARHHTFFEMLGNFSFGDYFKRDAIFFAWEFLTKELGLPSEKLWVTVYEDDDEAEAIWFNEVGIDQTRFSRLGEKDNFWSMGDTGPCGPCTEIFYDHGEDIPGDPPGGPNDDGDRYIEIWNLVFMQFNRSADGAMTPLPKPSVDTGMGLERIAAVMQHVHSNYEIDLFDSLLDSTASLLGVQDKSEKSLRVIADHIRSCGFLIADGIMPSNEGRGYTLRRIIRRAIRHGNKLGAEGLFFNELLQPLADLMGQAYPELNDRAVQVVDILKSEETQFAKTLDKGMKVLEADIAQLDGDVLSGHTIFTLYDTYGFPVDLTNDIARERGLSLDYEAYEAAMEAQRSRSQEASGFGVDYNDAIDVEGCTEFKGYDELALDAEVLSVVVDGEEASAEAGQRGIAVLAQTPFYAESGGQVGDRGWFEWSDGEGLVTDTQKQGDHFIHAVEIKRGVLKKGTTIKASVDGSLRRATALNHSATHLMHAALRELLGDEVNQKGSLVNSERLRFDFSYRTSLTADQLNQIELRVNEQIRGNSSVGTDVMAIEAAKQKGAMALFGEKYGDEVRVLTMGTDNFSVELCGGTHVSRTGDIGSFAILSEAGISAGVRRIEAVTGQQADALRLQQNEQLTQIAELLKGSKDEVFSKVSGLLEKNKQFEKELGNLKAKLATSAGSDLSAQAVEVGGVKVLAAQVDGMDRKSLLDAVDHLKNKLGQAVVFLATVDEGKAVLVAGVTKPLCDTVKAGDLIKEMAQELDGKGGGRPDMAQGGGSSIEKLDETLKKVFPWVESRV